MTNNEQKDCIAIRDTETGLLLEYDVPFLRAIIESLRLETDSFSRKMLLEYEYRQREAVRLEADRLQRIEAERNAGYQETVERNSDD